MNTETKEIELIGNLDHDAYLEYAENNGLELAEFEDWQDQADDAYYGQFDNNLDFAYELIEECNLLGDMPENLAQYFDYEKFSRDLMYDYFATDSGYYFLNC